ncbi:YlxR family protein [Mycobacterium sp. SMC-4]|uniref:YlxR family protein n=1 Tax=Mycobacterium sp. SMC-4 TaxID=2857059 RepID=UPI0037C73475
MRRRTAHPSEGPVRTCIGCRKRELAVELLRVVVAADGIDPGNGPSIVTVDAAGTLPGRGAWLHPDPQCLHAAIRRRAFGRALRITGSPDITAVMVHFGACAETR